MNEVFLLTHLNGSSQWAFANEADISPSLQLSYTDAQVSRVKISEYVVTYTLEDVRHTEVFRMQRVPFKEEVGDL